MHLFVSQLYSGQVRLALIKGGHTSEMLALLSSLPADQYAPFLYMVSSGDTHSSAKACAFEEQYRGTSKAREGLCVAVPRARSVGQSWLTTPFTVAWSLGFCMWAFGLAPLYAHWRRGTRLPFVDVILMNGPATCVPVALVAYAPRVRFLTHPSSLDCPHHAWCTSSPLHVCGHCRSLREFCGMSWTSSWCNGARLTRALRIVAY